MPLFDVDVKLNKRLLDDFIVPPFSTLDTRMGYWQDRKRMWAKIIGDSSETRNDDFGKSYNFDKPSYKGIKTSLFDPVLAELMYKWFCIPEGKVLDPFAGSPVRGVVAGSLGLSYTGVEIRQDQFQVNNNAIERLNLNASVHYLLGDSRFLETLVQDSYDCLLTSPPYFNLETYSKLDLSSAKTYADFLDKYEFIFSNCYEKMKDDTFCILQVGEVRGGDGAYVGFVPDTVNLLTDIGWKYYNEIILINQSGSGCLRAAGNMKSRKVVKSHQNVLVFYKGNTKNIVHKYENLRNGGNAE